jgi:cytoskeletal protein RodZ
MIDNFDTLVARCETIRRKRMIRLFLLMIGGLILVIGGILGYTQWTTSPKTAVAQSNPTLTPQPESNTTLSAPISDVNETNISSVPSPALPLTKPPLAPVQATAQAPAAALAPIVPASTPSAPIQTIAPDVKAAATTVVPPKNSRIFEVNTQMNDTPLDAYKNNPKYETALAVARNFYTNQNFVEAAVWAKKANQMNREAEEAWLLYAKSYYAQGRKNEAIGILELYLNYKDSKTATELIRTWKLNTIN